MRRLISSAFSIVAVAIGNSSGDHKTILRGARFG
jgi:hypothetical protein